MSVTIAIAYISSGSILIPLLIAMISKLYLNRQLIPLIVLLVISLLSDLISLALFRFSLNSYFVLNTFLLVQFLICSWLLKPRSALLQKIDNFVIILFLVFFIVNLFAGQGAWVFNSYSNSLSSIILMFFSLRYFYFLMVDLPEMFIYRIPMFWIATGILTYYSGNLFLFILNNYLTVGTTGSHHIVWILHNFLNIIKNLFFAYALWQSYRSRI